MEYKHIFNMKICYKTINNSYYKNNCNNPLREYDFNLNPLDRSCKFIGTTLKP